MQYQQKTLPEPQCIGHLETVYFLQLLLQGAAKIAENRGKNCQKYAVHNYIFFRYRMALKVYIKVQAL